MQNLRVAALAFRCVSMNSPLVVLKLHYSGKNPNAAAMHLADAAQAGALCCISFVRTTEAQRPTCSCMQRMVCYRAHNTQPAVLAHSRTRQHTLQLKHRPLCTL